MTTETFNIALAGQFDRIQAAFASWIQQPAHSEKSLRLFGLSAIPYQRIANISWRCGSLLCPRDTASMLSDLNALVYFCLTPPSLVQTAQGFDLDVAIASASNLAQHIAMRPDCRVVLVTRYFPDDGRKLGTCYNFWQQIIGMFKAQCPNLVVIQTMPVISDDDAVMLGMLENSQSHIYGSRNDSTDWLNLTSPISRNRLFEAIRDSIWDQTPQNAVILNGHIVLSYAELSRLISQSGSRLHPLKKMKLAIEPEARSRAQLLRETLAFHTTQTLNGDDKMDSHQIEELAEIFITNKTASRLLLEPEPGKQLHAKGYAQRMIAGPSRSVSEIADLLMQWLPRYFQRLVQVDNIGSSRLLCRLSRIPLLELEKHEESPHRCRLLLRNPWAHSIQSKASLLITSTEQTDFPGELLVIIEDGPESKLLTMGMRGLLMSFAKYLKEYGCGNEIPGKIPNRP